MMMLAIHHGAHDFSRVEKVKDTPDVAAVVLPYSLRPLPPSLDSIMPYP
eukprot:CAMPEP_0179456782 /NCGR_PEP_ID=MMETSP0799-20121207/40652_1 /TAXON_ID=46947 /ORGANISM="Geminigera cryophila, Strain CCMP2564" /LENGTH=48 /DNA_ID= /DNA_START= /DNA_END= /DNA_ORIENTATION=